MRNWNIEEIKSSNLPEEVKDMIEKEYNKDQLSSLDPNNFSQRNLTYKEFKQNYHDYLQFLYQLLGDNYFYTDILYKRYKYDEVLKYGFQESDLNDEDLKSNKIKIKDNKQ